MRILLDTCTFLWIITAEQKLSSNARELFVDPFNDVFLSYPIGALAIGSICAMFFNFAAMRRFAFTGSTTDVRAK